MKYLISRCVKFRVPFSYFNLLLLFIIKILVSYFVSLFLLFLSLLFHHFIARRLRHGLFCEQWWLIINNIKWFITNTLGLSYLYHRRRQLRWQLNTILLYHLFRVHSLFILRVLSKCFSELLFNNFIIKRGSSLIFLHVSPIFAFVRWSIIFNSSLVITSTAILQISRRSYKLRQEYSLFLELINIIWLVLTI